MRPANYCSQWLQFWQPAIGLIRAAHVEQIAPGEARNAGKLLLQVKGQLLYNRIAEGSSGLTAGNPPADVPIQLFVTFQPSILLLFFSLCAIQSEKDFFRGSSLHQS